MLEKLFLVAVSYRTVAKERNFSCLNIESLQLKQFSNSSIMFDAILVIFYTSFKFQKTLKKQ